MGSGMDFERPVIVFSYCVLSVAKEKPGSCRALDEKFASMSLRLLLGLLCTFLASTPAGAADLLAADGPDIPGHLGMNWFLGAWYPRSNIEAIGGGTMTIRPDGAIDYEFGYPKQKFGFPALRYKVVKETDKYVVLIMKVVSKRNVTPRDTISFNVVVPEMDPGRDRPGIPSFMRIRNCLRQSESGTSVPLAPATFDLDRPALLDLWEHDSKCNPAVGEMGATAANPWGEHYYWDDYPYHTWLRPEDHAREAGLKDLSTH